MKGFVHEVVICPANQVIARRPCSYEPEHTIFDPLRYLALLERKLKAVDQAAPLAGWKLAALTLSLDKLTTALLSGRNGVQLGSSPMPYSTYQNRIKTPPIDAAWVDR